MHRRIKYALEARPARRCAAPSRFVLLRRHAASAALAAVALLFVAPLVRASPLGAVAGITWTGAYDVARATAKREGKLIFVALNMDGERANDRLAEQVYRDKTLVALTADTINLVASVADHGKGKCSRFGGITCPEHQQVDIKVRSEILQAGTSPVVAPQHLFLSPEGKVLLSVPYEVRAGELEWCFHEAQRLVDPTYKAKATGKSQKPKRLLVGEVAPAAGRAPMPREVALERIAKLRKGTGEKHEILYELATADEPEARDEIVLFLRAGPSIGYDGSIGEDGRPALLRWIGEVSPASYWEMLEDFVGTGEIDLRREAVVAMEQLAAPEGLASLMKQLRKEKDDKITGGLLRALGACGGTDNKARSALLKASKDKDDLARRSAFIGLGWLEPDEDVHARLEEALAEGDPVDRAAAAAGMGLSRDARWIALLEPWIADGSTAPDVLKNAATAALDVIRGAKYERLQGVLQRVADDGMPRARLFGG